MDVRVISDSELSSLIPALAQILIDCVAGGASIGFLANVDQIEAEEFWQRVTTKSRDKAIVLIGAFVEEAIVGTVMLITNTPPNQPHRADVSKLLVSPKYRGRGIAKVLLAAIEDQAKQLERHLLTLDTETGSDADFLYRSLGWKEVGIIPGHALSPSGEPKPTTLFYKDLNRN